MSIIFYSRTKQDILFIVKVCYMLLMCQCITKINLHIYFKTIEYLCNYYSLNPLHNFINLVSIASLNIIARNVQKRKIKKIIIHRMLNQFIKIGVLKEAFRICIL